MYDGAPLSPNHSSSSSLSLISENSPHNFSPKKKVFYIFFFVFILLPTTNCPVSLFPQLWQFTSKRVIRLLLFLLLQKLVDLWPYFTQFLHIPLKNFVLVLFISPEFNTKTSYYVYFSVLLPPPSSVFQNQRIYFLGYL